MKKIFTLIFLMIVLYIPLGFSTSESKSVYHDERLLDRIRSLETERDSLVKMINVVTLTSYNPDTAQTDDTPFITASNKKVKHGNLALSRDLFTKANFGDTVYIVSTHIVDDKMNSRYNLWMDFLNYQNVDMKLNVKQSTLFGKQYVTAIIKPGKHKSTKK